MSRRIPPPDRLRRLPLPVSLAALALALAAGPVRAAAPDPVLGHPVQYVIVTTAGLAPSFAPLVDWKIRKGVPAAIQTLESIQAQYPAAADDAERVRLFLKNAHAAGARWTLIGGDTDVIPIRHASTTFYTGDPLPTDLYFACLDGSWNGDGDSRWGEGSAGPDPGDAADLVPELAVGRAPVRTPAEAARVVLRTIQYERFPAGDYEESRLFAANVLFPANWTPGNSISLDGAQYVEDLLPMFAAHGQHVARLYQNHLDPAWQPGALPLTRAALRDSLNRGYGFASVIGGDGAGRIKAGDGYLELADAMALANAARTFPLWLMGSQSCNPDSESIAEAFLKAPGGGAVVCLGSGHYSFPTAERAYFDRFQRLVHDSAEVRAGRTLNLARAPYVAYSGFDNVNRWVQMSLQMLGDPELSIWTRRPLAMSVSHGSTLTPGQELIVDVADAGGPLAGATVTLYQPGFVLAVLTTDAAGRARVTPVGAVDGPIAVTVTADQHRASETVVVFGAVTAAAASLVSSAVTAGRVTLSWYAAGWSAAATTLERRDAGGGSWSASGRIEDAGRGLLAGIDESVRAGARYLYRIALRENGETFHSPEVEIEVPLRTGAELALESVAPHPVSSGTRVTFTLAGRGAARLELFDLAGRMRWTRSLAGAGAGRHVIGLDGMDRLRPGLYLLRLAEAGVSRSRRIVIR